MFRTRERRGWVRGLRRRGGNVHWRKRRDSNRLCAGRQDSVGKTSVGRRRRNRL